MCGHSPAPKESSITWLQLWAAYSGTLTAVRPPLDSMWTSVALQGFTSPACLWSICHTEIQRCQWIISNTLTQIASGALATFLTQWKTQWDLKFDKRHFSTARTMQAAIFLPIFQPQRILCAVASARSELYFCITFTDGWKTQLYLMWKWNCCCIWNRNCFY